MTIVEEVVWRVSMTDYKSINNKISINIFNKISMKKLMMLLAFCGIAGFAMAAEETESYPTLKHQIQTNRFWDNWFIDAGITHLSFYSSQEHNQPNANKNPFWAGRRSWGGELSVGKWATPAFGLRAKFQAGWGTTVNYSSWKNGYPQGGNPTFNQLSISLQPMINLTNLIGGYKPRVWNISLYGGFGTMMNFDDDSYSMLGTVGVFNTFNITDRFHVNLDLYVNIGEEDLDGNSTTGGSPRIFKTRDDQFGISAGVGVNLGKVGWTNAPDMDAILANHKNQIDALNASIAGLEAENAALKDALAKKPKEVVKEVVKTVSEFQTTSASVFFNINKSTIASKKDLVNVKELANYAKDHNKKIVVTGYADSKTGSAAYNKALSERRAETVKKALVDMGVNASDIETVGQGGVADLTPYSYNRRAVVTLK